MIESEENYSKVNAVVAVNFNMIIITRCYSIVI